MKVMNVGKPNSYSSKQQNFGMQIDLPVEVRALFTQRGVEEILREADALRQTLVVRSNECRDPLTKIVLNAEEDGVCRSVTVTADAVTPFKDQVMEALRGLDKFYNTPFQRN